MFIPRQKIGPWAAELIRACTPDIEERIQRGALYRNLYLTGDENGNPATYPKTFAHVETLAAMLFSPLELHYSIKFNGGGNLTQRAMGRVASSELHEMLSEAGRLRKGQGRHQVGAGQGNGGGQAQLGG